MRDIKFRAWDKTSNRWVVDFRILPDGTVEFKTTGSLSDFARQVELSQYTGLKDKTRKEIYEGDILECTLDFKETGVIEFSKGRFLLKLKKHEVTFLYENKDVLTIVGNIFENPELLKEGNDEKFR